MEDSEHWTASKCLEGLRDAVGLSEFGFRIQALAAHILLRLGARVLHIHTQGHPDIVAETENGYLRIEVEAAVYGQRARALTKEDLVGIAPHSATDKGYFALAVCSPCPHWLLIDYLRILRRHGTPASPPILRGLADAATSKHWTDEFRKLLIARCRHLSLYTYDFLVHRALEGRPL